MKVTCIAVLFGVLSAVQASDDRASERSHQFEDDKEVCFLVPRASKSGMLVELLHNIGEFCELPLQKSLAFEENGHQELKGVSQRATHGAVVFQDASRKCFCALAQLQGREHEQAWDKQRGVGNATARSRYGAEHARDREQAGNATTRSREGGGHARARERVGNATLRGQSGGERAGETEERDGAVNATTRSRTGANASYICFNILTKLRQELGIDATTRSWNVDEHARKRERAGNATTRSWKGDEHGEHAREREDHERVVDATPNGGAYAREPEEHEHGKHAREQEERGRAVNATIHSWNGDERANATTRSWEGDEHARAQEEHERLVNATARSPNGGEHVGEGIMSRCQFILAKLQGRADANNASALHTCIILLAKLKMREEMVINRAREHELECGDRPLELAEKNATNNMSDLDAIDSADGFSVKLVMTMMWLHLFIL